MPSPAKPQSNRQRGAFMKGKKLTYIFSILLAVALLPLVAAADISHDAAYHSQSSVVTLQAQSQSPSSSQSQTQEQTKTFSGKITKSNGRYALEDLTTNSTYYLDDTKSAQKYEGKNVKVIGTLDASNNTIHVQKIEAV